MHVHVGLLSQDSTFDLFNFFPNFFSPKFELPNSGCGLSASAAYTLVFTVSIVNEAWYSFTKRSKKEEKNLNRGITKTHACVHMGIYMCMTKYIYAKRVNVYVKNRMWVRGLLIPELQHTWCKWKPTYMYMYICTEHLFLVLKTALLNFSTHLRTWSRNRSL